MAGLNRRIAIGLALAVFACASVAADFAREIVRIPLPDDLAPAMVAGVFRPEGDGPFPVLVYSHGRAGTALERSRTRVPEVRGHVRYWLAKGFAVVAPIRPGYGGSGGVDHEDSGVRYDVFGNCWGRPEFVRSAQAAAESVQATLAWVRHQPWADAKRIVLAGASMGGLASIASAAANPEGVIAYINFSGGTGGSGARAPEQSCGSEKMLQVLAALGATTHVPSLWLYAENDQYWGAEWPRAWHRAYAAYGEPTRFVMTPPVPDGDGHQLLARGARLWTTAVDLFLAELGF